MLREMVDDDGSRDARGAGDRKRRFMPNAGYGRFDLGHQFVAKKYKPSAGERRRCLCRYSALIPCRGLLCPLTIKSIQESTGAQQLAVAVQPVVRIQCQGVSGKREQNVVTCPLRAARDAREQVR